MNNTRIAIALSTFASLSMFAAPLRAEAEWSTDFAAAKKQAADAKLDLLLDFTGSDWCGPCISLHKTVLSTPVFEEAVKDSFVLVELDYPRGALKLPPETAKQNEQLKKDYCITGYPTVMLCDASGLPYAGMIGFGQTTPQEYVANLAKLREKHAARDKAFAEARAAATGPEKAKGLIAALKAMGLDDGVLYAAYADVVAEILKADPSDPGGFNLRAESKRALAAYQTGLSAFLEEPGIHAARMIGDIPGALAYTQKALDEGKFQPDEKVWIVTYRASNLLARTNIDEAIQSLETYPENGLSGEGLKTLQGNRDGLKARKAYLDKQAEKKAAPADTATGK